MPAPLCFFLSIALALIVWGILAQRYIWPRLRILSDVEALQPILLLHSFRFIGLAFLVPGVVSTELPAAFARPAALGDLIASLLAILSLALLPRRGGIALAWVFNVWGFCDLLDAFYQANAAGLIPGQLGTAYFLPTVLVPLLLVTHVLAFRILLRRPSTAAVA